MKMVYLLLLYLGGIVASNAQNIEFSHLGLNEGLSQVSVNTTYQDEFGRIWIGTRDGLNLYDGNKFRTFFPERGDTTGLQHSNINELTGDKNGSIYINSQGTLTHLDLKKEKFTTLLRKNVMAISHTSRDLLIATRSTILRYHPDSGKTDSLYSFPRQLIISDIHEDKQGRIWLASEEGIFRLSTTLHIDTVIPQVKATNIYEDSRHRIWIGTWTEGVYIFDQELRYNKLSSPILSSDFVRDVCEDNNGNFWIGTFKGLDLYHPANNTVVAFYSGIEKGGPLSHSSIWSIMKDHQGSIWLGTYFGGLSYFNPEYDFYQYYIPEEGNSRSLSSPIIGKMIEDKDHRLWICTEGGGLNCFNRKTRTFKSYRHQAGNPHSLSHDNLKSIWYDEEKGLLWIGTHTGGLNRFDIKTETFRSYRHDKNNPHSIPNDIIRDIKPYQGKLLLATYNGVCLFDPETEKATRLFEKEKYGYDLVTIIALFFDADNKLWISVGGEGVFSYDFATDQLKNYRYEPNNLHSINSLVVNCIFQDHKFRLWFGNAENGLNLYRPETDDFVSFSKQNSDISSNHISSVLESRYGYLLIATGQGFSRFDVERQRFYNYNRETGFPLTTINDGAAHITNDGEIFLGGITGLVSFFEKELNRLPEAYRINLEQLSVNNREIKPGDGSGILSESILTTDKIQLGSRHTVFSISFSTSNYIASNRKKLEYRLVGFDRQWIEAESHNVTYTNLNPGKYYFELREKDPEQINKGASRSIEIVIAPPFYKTWYAFLFYCILVILIVWWLWNYQHTKALLALEKKEKKQIEELNQKKLRFFTNVSHEFRTPISLIMGQTEMLLETPNLQPSAYNKALSIYNNSRKMNELISELIDFRKQEQGYTKLKVARLDIVSFLYELYLNFKGVAEHKKLRINFHSTEEKIELWFDSNQLQKVFNNLLSNAFKYTPEGGCIDIGILTGQKDVEIRIKDSGIGIPKASQEKVFERFYQEETPDMGHGNPGSGIGLALAKGIVDLHKGSIRVESEPGKGSEFIVSLPLEYTFSANETNLEIQEDPAGEYLGELPTVGNLFEAGEELPETFKPQDLKLFVVEDNDELREMLVRIFSPLYEVQSASDGEHAFEAIKEWQPDLVISDIMMPKVSGTELCAQIKNDFETSHIPVVLLTARTSIEHNIEGLKIGADDYITKPFNIRILIARCNNLVNSRRVLQEKFSKHPTFSAKITATNPIDKEAIEKAQSIVEKYIDDSSFDVNVFAREMALGRTKLFAKIKGITGQTPNEFIQTIKLKKAAFWLKNNPELSIADITYSLGFSSPRYFSKCFKDAFGVAPIYFRKGEEAANEEEETGEE